jgi:hypothetical protein
VQFSDASVNGSAIYAVNSTSALLINLATDPTASSNDRWGWAHDAYWLTQPATVTFATGGVHSLRIQVREAGVAFDQIVLSPAAYLTSAPGARTNDATIVAKPTPPAVPGAPAAPSPSDASASVAATPTLTWSAGGATTYDVRFGTANPPALVSAGQRAPSYAPPALASGTRYFWQITATNAAGSTAGPVWSFSTAGGPADVVIYASDIPAANIHGLWTRAGDGTSPNGVKLVTPVTAWSTSSAPLAEPADYFEVAFNAVADTPYTMWLRLQATDNAKSSDSVWVQFSDAQVNGAPAYPIHTTSGLLAKLASDGTGSSDNAWGWVNGAYWLQQPASVTFPTSGIHTLRIQVRFSGVQVDQIVLSASTYFNAGAACPSACTGSPGLLSDDHTIVARPSVAAAPPPPADIVLYASDVASSGLHGTWRAIADGSSPNGMKLVSADEGAPSSDPLGMPVNYVDVAFDALAAIPYTLWMRVQAAGDSKYNDSLWVQFSGALIDGAPAYGIGSTSALLVNLASDPTGAGLAGWGWVNSGYWLDQRTRVTFATSGPHTMRVQVREDGVAFDQIVLSPGRYASPSASCPPACTGAPGPLANDRTIVPKP